MGLPYMPTLGWFSLGINATGHGPHPIVPGLNHRWCRTVPAAARSCRLGSSREKDGRTIKEVNLCWFGDMCFDPQPYGGLCEFGPSKREDSSPSAHCSFVPLHASWFWTAGKYQNSDPKAYVRTCMAMNTSIMNPCGCPSDDPRKNHKHIMFA